MADDDQKVRIRIEATSDTDAIKKMEAELDRLKVKNKEVGAEANKTTWFGRLRGEIKELGQEFPLLGRGMELFGRIGSSAVAQLVVGVGLLTAAFKGAASAIREFANEENAFAKMDTALAQTGQLTDEFRDRLFQLAVQLEETSGKAKEEWMQALTSLIQVGVPVGEMDQYAEAVRNLAGLMNGNVTQAATAVGKAMAGQFDAFREAGIVIDLTLPQYERMQQLFKELALRGGGQLESFSKTLTGSWEKLGFAASSLAAAVGSLIDKFTPLRDIMDQATLIMGYWADKLRATQEPVEGLENALKKTTRALGDNSDAAALEKAAMEALGDVLDDTRTKYGALMDQQRQLHQMRMQELKLQQDLQVKQIEASDMPESVKRERVARVRGTFDQKMFEEVQSLRQEEIKSINEQLEALRAQAAFMDTAVQKERDRLAVEKDYNNTLAEEKRLLDQINAVRQARNLLDSDGGRGLLPPTASPALKDLATFSTAAPHGAVDMDAVAAAEARLGDVVTKLGSVRRRRDQQREVTGQASPVPLPKLEEARKAVRDELEKIEREAAKTLPILSEELQSQKRQFKLQQEIRRVETAKELQAIRDREELQRIEAQRALLDNQARQVRDRGDVPAGEVNAMADLDARRQTLDRSTPPDVKNMRIRDIREDAEETVQDDFKSARQTARGRMPNFTKAAQGVALVVKDQSEGTDELINLTKAMLSEMARQKQEIQQLKIQGRYNLNQ